MKNVLIFGGTGSWGKELTKKLLTLRSINQIVIFNRNEYNSVAMNREFNNKKLKFIIGDIRDYDAVLEATRNIDHVFLLSALKHVPLCEYQPTECIRTNIEGVNNVIKASITNKVKKVIDVSTDKACSPSTVYGASKFIGERLILDANNKSTTKFMCIRSGNVIGSAGSCVPLFIAQIKENNYITLTDKDMTRYFMSLPEAIDLLLKASKLNIGDLLVTNMPSCSIGDLAKVIIKKYGNSQTKIIDIGNRGSEKTHEELINETEAKNTYIYNDKYYLISNRKISNLPLVTFSSYNSNSQPLMNEEEILTMLKKGGF
jgi:FlaA1/EpsC-like NDP-sugar epimerase